MLLFEVGEAKVVVELGFFGEEFVGLYIRLDALLIVAHLVQRDSKIQESFVTFTLALVQVV